MPIFKSFAWNQNKYKTKSDDKVVHYFIMYAKTLDLPHDLKKVFKKIILLIKIS